MLDQKADPAFVVTNVALTERAAFVARPTFLFYVRPETNPNPCAFPLRCSSKK